MKSSGHKRRSANKRNKTKGKLPVEQIRPTSVYAVSIIFILLCVVGVVAPSNTNYSDFYREAIAEIGAIALLVYWLYNNRKVQNITVTIDTVSVFLIALLLFASVSGFWAANTAFFVSKYFLWLGAAGILLVALTLAHNTQTYLVLARTLVLVATYIAVIGLIQALLSVDVFVQTKPPAANFVNRNAAAQVLVLIFPLSLFLLLVDRHKYLSKLYSYAIVLMLAYIFHTNTRAAWLGVSLGILLIIAGIIWQRKHIKEVIQRQHNIYMGFRQSLHLVLAVILLIILINISAEGWTFFGRSVADNVGQLHSDITRGANRYSIWAAAIDMIKQNPLIGSGMGSFYHNLLTQAERYSLYAVLRVHNDLLELAIELGVIGWFLLLGAVIGLLTALYKIITQVEAEHRLFYLAIAAGLAGSALNMLFSFPYQMPVPLLIFGLYAGCIIKVGDAYGWKIKTIKLSLHQWHWNASVSFVGLILVLVIAVNFIWLNAAAKITDNFAHNRWQHNLVNNPLVCHRVLVKSLSDSFSAREDNTNYHFTLAILESFRKCIPNTWVYQNSKALALLLSGKPVEAAGFFKLAKQHAPKENCRQQVNEIVAYHKMNDVEGALRAYNELIAQPVELLIKDKEVLKQIILISLKFNQKKQAQKFHRLFRQHYDGKKFLAKVEQYFVE